MSLSREVFLKHHKKLNLKLENEKKVTLSKIKVKNIIERKYICYNWKEIFALWVKYKVNIPNMERVDTNK